MTTSALPSELDDDAHSHSGRHQLHREHSGDLEAHFLHVRHLCAYLGLNRHDLLLSCRYSVLMSVAIGEESV